MVPHEQRVVAEKAELEERRIKLAAFTTTPTFAALPEEDKLLLLAQHKVMHEYVRILEKRIARFV